MDKSVIYRNPAMETVNIFLVSCFEGVERLLTFMNRCLCNRGVFVHETEIFGHTFWNIHSDIFAYIVATVLYCFEKNIVNIKVVNTAVRLLVVIIMREQNSNLFLMLP